MGGWFSVSGDCRDFWVESSRVLGWESWELELERKRREEEEEEGVEIWGKSWFGKLLIFVN